MIRSIRGLAATATAAALALTLAAPATAAPSLTSKDRAYVRLVKSEAPELRPVPGRMLVRLAHLNCAAMRQEADPIDLVHEAVDAGFSIDTGIVVVASAAAFYCPDTEYLFNDWTNV